MLRDAVTESAAAHGALKIGNTTGCDGDEFPACPASFAKEIKVIAIAMVPVEIDFSVFPLHAAAPFHIYPQGCAGYQSRRFRRT